MQELLSELKANALQLVNISRGAYDAPLVQELFAKQEDLVQEISARKNSLSPEEQACINEVEGLNTAFIQNLKIRKGLIEKEIQTIHKTASGLQVLKELYGPSKLQRPKRINRVS
jgi:hypothetical protein